MRKSVQSGRSGGRCCGLSPWLLSAVLTGLLVLAGNAALYYRAKCASQVSDAQQSTRETLAHLDSAENQLARFKKDRQELQKEVERLSAALTAAREPEDRRPGNSLNGHELQKPGPLFPIEGDDPPAQNYREGDGQDPEPPAKNDNKRGEPKPDPGRRPGLRKPVAARKPLVPFPLSDAQQDYYQRLAENGGRPGQDEEEAEGAPRDPRHARALLIICYNRPDYLRRSLTSVLKYLPRYNRPHIYVSQDGDVGSVTEVINDFARQFKETAPDVKFNHIRHPPLAQLSKKGDSVQGWAVGYYKLSQHFKWALDKLFVEAGHPRVIILEDDLEVAPDFFDYFSATEQLLDSDETLLGASAWSDLGQAKYIADPRQVHRSDFFPGLGWMMTSHAWEELGPKWPEAFWDDWLREPPQRKGRHFLRPEVSRTYTYGESGVSQAQFFAQYLGNIHLNTVPVDWSSEDLSYLALEAWDRDLATAVGQARKVRDIGSAQAEVCSGPGAVTTGVSLDGSLVPKDFAPGTGPSDLSSTDLVLVYPDEEGYRSIASAFGFIDDIKARVPRTAYKGVSVIKHNGCRKLFVAQAALAQLGQT